MMRASARRKEALRELGWKALVADLGVANATRFVMELHEGKQDYSKLRGKPFADKTLDQLYEIGMRIGELSLGAAFNSVLSWGWIDNRPFLRCMHGYALCLWRLGKTTEAAAVFERMLWLNPSDNQGERFNFHWIREGRAWEETER